MFVLRGLLNIGIEHSIVVDFGEQIDVCVQVKQLRVAAEHVGTGQGDLNNVHGLLRRPLVLDLNVFLQPIRHLLHSRVSEPGRAASSDGERAAVRPVIEPVHEFFNFVGSLIELEVLHEMLELSEAQEAAGLVLVERLLGSIFLADGHFTLLVPERLDIVDDHFDLFPARHQVRLTVVQNHEQTE